MGKRKRSLAVRMLLLLLLLLLVVLLAGPFRSMRHGGYGGAKEGLVREAPKVVQHSQVHCDGRWHLRRHEAEEGECKGSWRRTRESLSVLTRLKKRQAELIHLRKGKK